MCLAPPDTVCDDEVNSTFARLSVSLPQRLFRDAMAARDGACAPNLEMPHSRMFIDPRIEGVAIQIQRAATSGRPAYAIASAQAAYAMVALLLDEAGKVTRRPGAPAPISAQERSSIEDLIHDRMETGLTRTTLASATGRDVYPFARAFRLYAGTTPHQYVTRRRIGRARHMLRGPESLADIA